MDSVIPRHIKTVIWDLDGTMLDSFGVFRDILGQMVKKYDRTLPSPEMMLANFHGDLGESISGVFGGVPEQELSEMVKEFLELQDTVYAVIEHHLFPDALRLTQRLHAAGKRQIMVTNRGHEGRLRASPRHIVAHSQLHEYIDTVICGDDSAHHKPEPQVLGALITSINLSETIVIGDQHVDAQFAVNLGAAGIIVSRNAPSSTLTHYLKSLVDENIQQVQSLNKVNV